MCCSSSPNVHPAVGRAKCASIAAFVTGILAALGGLFGLAISAGILWIGAIGASAGLMAIISSSILMCCSPSQKGAGKSTHITACVLHVISVVAYCAGIGIMVNF